VVKKAKYLVWKSLVTNSISKIINKARREILI